MVARELHFDRTGSGRPVPISVLIQAANTFGCDIYIRIDKCRVSVKNYEELLRILCTQKGGMVIYFDGVDEQEAEIKFQQIAEEPIT